MGEIKPCEFRANSSCRERMQLSEKKGNDSLSRRRRPDRSWQFLQRSRRSMRIFRRSKILRQSRSIFDDAISARYQYRIGPREGIRADGFLIAFRKSAKKMFVQASSWPIALRGHQEKNFAAY